MIPDAEWIVRYKRVKERTRKLWSNPNNKYGSRVFWQRKWKRNGEYYDHSQPLGKTWFYSYPEDIADFVGIETYYEYSGLPFPVSPIVVVFVVASIVVVFAVA